MDEPKSAGEIAATLGLTKRSLREIDTLASILERRPTFAEFAYQHAVLCQVGLPRRRVDGPRFMRRSGAAWLNVQAGMLERRRRTSQAAHPLRSAAAPSACACFHLRGSEPHAGRCPLETAPRSSFAGSAWSLTAASASATFANRCTPWPPATSSSATEVSP